MKSAQPLTLETLKRAAASLRNATTTIKPDANGDYWFFLHPDADIPEELKDRVVLIDKLPSIDGAKV